MVIIFLFQEKLSNDLDEIIFVGFKIISSTHTYSHLILLSLDLGEYVY